MSDLNKQEHAEPQDAAAVAAGAEPRDAASEAAKHGEPDEQTDASVQQANAANPEAKRGKGMSNRKKIAVVGVVVVIVVAIGAGMFAWHEQPSFCGAICHSPMDSYLKTYESQSGQTGVDKWGNQVSDSSSMLASVHSQYGKTCLDCHKPVLSEQMSEGVEWLTGSYDSVLTERTTSQLITASGAVDSDEFCMNSSCHNYSREDLEKKTSWMGKINPHTPQHGEQKCSTCHKAHRQSVMYCTQCHTEAVVPDGWVDYTTSKQIEESSSAQ